MLRKKNAPYCKSTLLLLLHTSLCIFCDWCFVYNYYKNKKKTTGVTLRDWDGRHVVCCRFPLQSNGDTQPANTIRQKTEDNFIVMNEMNKKKKNEKTAVITFIFNNFLLFHWFVIACFHCQYLPLSYSSICFCQVQTL